MTEQKSSLHTEEGYGEDCCAVLLRGGKSRRMGRDKASLIWGEKTFLQAVASQMDFLEEKYLSVAANGNNAAKDVSGQEKHLDDGLSSDWVRMPDLIPDRGPLGGIYTGLCTCRAKWVLVASCDIPAVERRFFDMLLENRAEDLDIIYPLTPDGRMHMTCALYRKSIAPIVREQLEKGDNRLRVLNDLCRSRAILIEQPDYLRMLSNINTEDDLGKIRT